jgi:hypothetical protein
VVVEVEDLVAGMMVEVVAEAVPERDAESDVVRGAATIASAAASASASTSTSTFNSGAAADASGRALDGAAVVTAASESDAPLRAALDGAREECADAVARCDRPDASASRCA